MAAILVFRGADLPKACLKGLFIAVVMVASPLNAAETADNWPQWRGPHLNGTSTKARNLPASWSETENVFWRTELPGWAAGTPIVWEDTIFVTSAEAGFTSSKGSGFVAAAVNRVLSALNLDNDILLVAINRKDGSIRWQRAVGEGNKVMMKQNMASPSPVTDGSHVWVMTGTGTLTCLDFHGNQIWQRNIQEDYGHFGLLWGYASSPLLRESRLYLQVLHGTRTDDPSYVFAVDAKTGQTLWRVERPTDQSWETPDSYSTPMPAEVDGKTRLIINGGGYVTGHELDTGQELWRGGGFNPTNGSGHITVASSLVVGDMVFVPSRRKPFIAFRTGGSGDVTESHRMWSIDYGPTVPTPTTDGERLYIVDDRGIGLCLRIKDGSTVWGRSRLEPGTYSASPILADGKIYATSEDGATTVFEADDGFKILSVNKLNNYTLATPAVAGEQIFIRTAEYLYCIAQRSRVSD